MVLCLFPCSVHRHPRVSPLSGSVDMMIEVRGTGMPFGSVHHMSIKNLYEDTCS